MTALHRWLILVLDLSKKFSAVYYNPGHSNDTFWAWWAQYKTPILSGLSSDLLFVLTFAMLGVALRAWVVMPLLLLGVFYSANIEHIHYNFTHIRLDTIYIALDPTFIEGSGMTGDFLKHVGIMAAIVVGGFVVMQFRWVSLTLAPAAMLAILAVLALPRGFDPLNPAWMQSHPLFFTHGAAAASDAQIKVSDRPFNPVSPLAGRPKGTKHNVLIVYLEGVSQVSIENGDMPFLKSLAQTNLSFERYFGNQIQTHNGLYTSLTSQLPNFLKIGSPWDTLGADDPAARNALPTLLYTQGYHTAFLQSADLSFMSKDKHMAQLGFQKVLGRGDWQHFDQANGWGIDDLSLFENALDYIDGQDPEGPWMVALLTSGTHAPYNVPGDFMPEERTRMRALKYADAAAKALMLGLKDRELLESTVVIFTADESREPGVKSTLENELLLNWLPLIVVHPAGGSERVEWPLSAATFRNLALTVAGDWVRDDIEALNRPNVPLIFGNYYNSRVFWFDQMKDEFLACYTQDFLCAKFSDVSDVTALNERAPDGVFVAPKIQALFELHEKSGR